MTKTDARRAIATSGDPAAQFVANVVENWHADVAKKLKGIARLLAAGHTVRTGHAAIDVLVIDGHAASWCVLEEWANRVA